MLVLNNVDLISLVILSIPVNPVKRSITGIHKLTTDRDIIGLLILLVMYTGIWNNDQNVVILVDGLELLVLILPEEMNVQTRAHMMASVSVDRQVAMVDVILYYSPLKDKVCGMSRGYQKGAPN